MEAQLDDRYQYEIARLFPLRGEWSERDYFNLPDTNHFLELSDGEIIMPPHPTDSHQRIAFDLALLLRQFVEQHNLGTVRFAPLPVRLWEGKIREPDVLFMRAEHRDRIHEQYWDRADWVAEIISPGTRSVDEDEKRVEYAQAGIPEYWLIDPEAGTVRVYTLPDTEADAYTLAGTYSAGQTAPSPTLAGFTASVDDLLSAP